MNTFRELFETKKAKKELTAKELQKLIKKNGDTPVIILGQDIWVNIETVEDGYAYGIDQFDDDREIDLSKETLQLAESSLPTDKELADLFKQIPKEYKSITDKRDSIVAGLLQDYGYKLSMKLTDLATDYVKSH
ncbi:MAG: hypothetical protein J7L15_03260 [Clostridiales bacterium]|nr:hypothetical protein [Clostridiales bacterium]